MELKKSTGLAVADIAARLGMSYMGTKAQCLALEKSGHLTSRNRHSGNGRPRLVYRLTAKGQSLFATEDQHLAISLLREARTLFGPAAPEKLLFLHFQTLGAEYLGMLSQAPTVEARLSKLASLRDSRGHMSQIINGALVEFQIPLSSIFREWPSAMAMEEAMLSKVVGTPLKRTMEGEGDHQCVRFEAFRCGPATD